VRNYLLDSFAMIAFFEDEPGADRVERILKAILGRKARGYMSVINWGEIYYNTMREQGIQTAENVIRQLKKYSIVLIDADQHLTYEAAKLKGKHKIAYADCFAAALAMRMNALVVTGDPEFKKFDTDVKIEWI
jgi:ribonuclease VapC